MKYDEFKETLKRYGLTIKEFARLCGLNPKSISITWKSKNEVPQWVESWLTNYIKAKTLDSVKEVICEAPAPSPIGPTPADQSDEVDDG